MRIERKGEEDEEKKKTIILGKNISSCSIDIYVVYLFVLLVHFFFQSLASVQKKYSTIKKDRFDAIGLFFRAEK